MATAMMNIHQFMKELLTFEDQKIKMVGTADEPWFCARDVCNVLGYSDYRKAIVDHVYHEDKMSLYELRRSWRGIYHFHFIPLPLGVTDHQPCLALCLAALNLLCSL